MTMFLFYTQCQCFYFLQWQLEMLSQLLAHFTSDNWLRLGKDHGYAK